MATEIRALAARGRTAAPPFGGRRAFTVLEILLVLTLIMMLSAVLVTGSMHLLREKPVTPEDVFWKAVGETRKQALRSGRDVYLRYEGKDRERALVARNADGTEERFPFGGEGELTVDFLSTQKNASAILIRGQLIETQTIPFVTFFGDGTCSPFRLQVRTGGAARILDIDPWTCALVLLPGESSP